MPTDQWNSTAAVAAGGLLVGWLLSATNSAPSSPNKTMAFSAMGVLTLYSERRETRITGSEGAEGRQERRRVMVQRARG